MAPPYPSYHKRNIMFGYVVKAINIPDNITKIEKLQNKLLTTVQTGEFIFVESGAMNLSLIVCISLQ